MIKTKSGDTGIICNHWCVRAGSIQSRRRSQHQDKVVATKKTGPISLVGRHFSGALPLESTTSYPEEKRQEEKSVSSFLGELNNCEVTSTVNSISKYSV